MSKELDDTLNDQLHMSELQDGDLGNLDSDVIEYEDEDEDEETEFSDDVNDDEDLALPKTGLSPIMKAILGVAGAAVIIGTGGIAYLTLASSNSAPLEPQNTAIHISDTFAPEARSNLDLPLDQNSASSGQQNDGMMHGLTTPEQIIEKAPLSHLEQATGIIQAQPQNNVVAGVTKEEMDKFKADFEAELEEKYLAKFSSMASSLKSDFEIELNKKTTDTAPLSNDIAELRKELQQLKDSKLNLADTNEIKKINEELATKLSVARLSEKEKSELLDGRVRLQGFMVLTASIDGEMSIVRTPSDRVNVFFKGELFNNAGDFVKVTDVTDGGYLILVGDKHYIDDNYVERAKVKPAKVNPPKKEVKPQVVKKPTVDKNTSTEKSVKVKSSEVDSKAYRAQEINGKKVAVGWVKSGEYSQGYLVSSPSGDWTPVKIGDELKGLGRVTGEDFDGNLIVGNFVVLAAE